MGTATATGRTGAYYVAEATAEDRYQLLIAGVDDHGREVNSDLWERLDGAFAELAARVVRGIEGSFGDAEPEAWSTLTEAFAADVHARIVAFGASILAARELGPGAVAS